MQMRSTVSSPCDNKVNILIPRISEPRLAEIQSMFPEIMICQMKDRSVSGHVRLEAERLATSPLLDVDSERYDLNLVGKEVAGYQHAVWLLDRKPETLLRFLRGGNSLEFPGTRVLCKSGKELHNPRLKLVRGALKFIPVMPRMDNGSPLRIIWTPLGAGDREHATRFARVFQR